jgi:hypothetical protein
MSTPQAVDRRSCLETEKRLAKLHRLLCAEMTLAEHADQEQLVRLLEAACLHTGAAVCEAAQLTNTTSRHLNACA